MQFLSSSKFDILSIQTEHEYHKDSTVLKYTASQRQPAGMLQLCVDLVLQERADILPSMDSAEVREQEGLLLFLILHPETGPFLKATFRHSSGSSC